MSPSLPLYDVQNTGKIHYCDTEGKHLGLNPNSISFPCSNEHTPSYTGEVTTFLSVPPVVYKNIFRKTGIV